jgi:hypothetical protein
MLVPVPYNNFEYGELTRRGGEIDDEPTHMSREAAKSVALKEGYDL